MDIQNGLGLNALQCDFLNRVGQEIFGMIDDRAFWLVRAGRLLPLPENPEENYPVQIAISTV